MSKATQINPNINSNSTVINSAVNNGTVINPALNGVARVLESGVILNGRYTVTEKLPVSAGEADIFLCTDGAQTFAVKLYRRTAAIKPEIVDLLKNIDCPNVAKIIDIGTYNNYPFEIMPYYSEGSLQGKTFDLQTLKQNVIPSINSALHVLHEKGIIHKDLKPSNIMSFNHGRDFALIDFGISTVLDDGNTLVQTRTGMTPEYSAPETFRGVYQLEDSDYYSFGVTLYELFCGHTPYKNMSTDEIAKYMAAQSLPFPEDMPVELRNLITGLTYSDITHRNEKDNPNKRWGFEEVNKWNKGIALPLPGENKMTATTMPAYTFLKQKYYDISSLVNAFAMHWEDGKKQLFRGILSGFLKTIDPEKSGYCIDAEDEFKRNSNNEDFIFWKLLYQLDDTLDKLVWKGQIYNDLKDLGEKVLQQLRREDSTVLENKDLWNEILDQCLLSNYVQLRLNNQELYEAVRGLEGEIRNLEIGEDHTLLYYHMGYLLSGDKEFMFEGKMYSSIDELINTLNEAVEHSFDTFLSLCKKLMLDNNYLEPQFESWLLAIGKGSELEKWRQGLNQ